MPGAPDVLLARAAGLVAAGAGAPVVVARWERISPWFVARGEVADPAPGVPGSIVVKWLREDPNGFRTDPRQIRTEAAALAFLDSLGLGLTPRLLAHDDDVLVVEDLAPRIPLATILRDGAVAEVDERFTTAEGFPAGAAEAGLRGFATATGRLHAATAGSTGRRLEPGPDERMLHLVDGWPEVSARLAGWGVPARAADTEAAAVRQGLAQPGPFLCFSSGDAGANNFLVRAADGGDGRIIDFEHAGFRSALIDATALYMPHPFWLSMADPIAGGAAAAYRAALAGGVAAAEDDAAFGPALVGACMAKAISRLGELGRVEARPPGHPSRQQIASILRCAALTAEAHRCFPALRSWSLAAIDALARRWPDLDPDAHPWSGFVPRDRGGPGK